MTSRTFCTWTAVLLLAAYVAAPGTVSAQQATNVLHMPPHTYPFASYLNPYAACMTNEAPPAVFLPDYPWGGTNETDSCLLRGIAADAQMWLQAEVGGIWNGAWLVSERDGTVVASNTQQTLDFSLLPRGAYKVQIWPDVAADPLPPFWVAWPSNTVPACRFPATGNVHGKIVKHHNAISLHVWGQAREPLAAATSDAGGAPQYWRNSFGQLFQITLDAQFSNPLWQLPLVAGESGVTQAWLRVDGNVTSITLDAAGKFDLSLPVRRTRNGVHDIALLAVARNQSQSFAVDREYVSENETPFPRPPSDGGNGDGSVTHFNNWHFIPSGLAVAFPRLNEEGLLVLDGNESIGAALFHWTVRDLITGTQSQSHVPCVNTECLPTGFYEVTLDCSGQNGMRYGTRDANGNWVLYPLDPYADQDVTQFDLVIPPRVNLATRQANGALHTRWVFEKINKKWTWCIYLSGHVFDGLGTSMYDFDANNLCAWVTINGVATQVTLDPAGQFLARWAAGTKLAPAYDLSLSVRTLDDGREYLLDSLHETKMSIFPTR